jgi:SAM-dependent methyltransferase
LREGYNVFGVEPNEEMRLAGEQYLKAYPNFHSINGTAENTTLAAQSVDLVMAGTAFHWFQPAQTKAEFRRILKPNGHVLLVWNVRDFDIPLMQDYEQLIRNYGRDYSESGAHKFNNSVGEEFFNPYAMKIQSYPNIQQFDWAGFKGRLLSTSYALRPTDAKYEAMVAALKEIFDRYQKNGLVDFRYNTKLYYGQFKIN